MVDTNTKMTCSRPLLPFDVMLIVCGSDQFDVVNVNRFGDTDTAFQFHA